MKTTDLAQLIFDALDGNEYLTAEGKEYALELIKQEVDWKNQPVAPGEIARECVDQIQGAVCWMMPSEKEVVAAIIQRANDCAVEEDRRKSMLDKTPGDQL